MQHKSSRVFCWLTCLLTYSQKCFMTLLGKGLLPDIEAKCGHHKWTLQHDGTAAHTARNTMEYGTWRKRRSISSSLTYGTQTARILIPSITLSEMPFSNEFITDENSRLWKNWSKQLSLSGKTYRNVSLTVVSMNDVVVLNVLSRMAVGISNIAISLSNSLGCCAIVFLLWLSIEL